MIALSEAKYPKIYKKALSKRESSLSLSIPSPALLCAPALTTEVVYPVITRNHLRLFPIYHDCLAHLPYFWWMAVECILARVLIVLHLLMAG